MSLESLKTASNPTELQTQLIDSILATHSEIKVKEFIDEASNLPYNLFSSVVKGIITKVNEIQDLDFGISVLKVIENMSQSKNINELLPILADQFSKSYEKLGNYPVAARYMEQVAVPDDENENLRYHLRKAELNLKAVNDTKVSSILIYLNDNIFRQRTPKDIQDNFDLLRGLFSIQKSSFKDAIRAFQIIISRSKNEDIRYRALQLTAVCACLDSAGDNGLAKRLSLDDKVKAFPFYSFLDLIAHDQFVDSAEQMEFLKTASPVVGCNIEESLKMAAIQHNLKMAERMFKTVKIERLAQLIGTSLVEIERQLKSMIAERKISATIDQIGRLVVFEAERVITQDEAIYAYSLEVNSLCNSLSHL